MKDSLALKVQRDVMAESSASVTSDPDLKDSIFENDVSQLIRQYPGSWKIDLQLFGIFVIKNYYFLYKTLNFKKISGGPNPANSESATNPAE